ncbi:transcription elongation factor GreA, partial [Lactococcus lactis]
MEKTFPMTQEGLDKLKLELENLKLVKRPEVIDRIKVARSYGDLSENSEYGDNEKTNKEIEAAKKVADQLKK